MPLPAKILLVAGLFVGLTAAAYVTGKAFAPSEAATHRPTAVASQPSGKPSASGGATPTAAEPVNGEQATYTRPARQVAAKPDRAKAQPSATPSGAAEASPTTTPTETASSQPSPTGTPTSSSPTPEPSSTPEPAPSDSPAPAESSSPAPVSSDSPSPAA